MNVLPAVRSIHRWNDAVPSDEEGHLIMKTAAGCRAAARERLVELHPCEVPEVVALAVADGHHAYLSWVASATRTP